MLRLTVTVVKRSDDARGFVVVPRRWVVERTFGWLMRHSRLVRDYERLPEHHDGPRVFRTAAWWLLCCLLPVQVLVVDLEWGLVAES